MSEESYRSFNVHFHKSAHTAPSIILALAIDLLTQTRDDRMNEFTSLGENYIKIYCELRNIQERNKHKLLPDNVYLEAHLGIYTSIEITNILEKAKSDLRTQHTANLSSIMKTIKDSQEIVLVNFRNDITSALNVFMPLLDQAYIHGQSSAKGDLPISAILQLKTDNLMQNYTEHITFVNTKIDATKAIRNQEILEEIIKFQSLPKISLYDQLNSIQHLEASLKTANEQLLSATTNQATSTLNLKTAKDMLETSTNKLASSVKHSDRNETHYKNIIDNKLDEICQLKRTIDNYYNDIQQLVFDNKSLREDNAHYLRNRLVSSHPSPNLYAPFLHTPQNTSFNISNEQQFTSETPFTKKARISLKTPRNFPPPSDSQLTSPSSNTSAAVASTNTSTVSSSSKTTATLDTHTKAAESR